MAELNGTVSGTKALTGNMAAAYGTKGVDGKDGVSATHEWNGTVLTVASASGSSSADLKGSKGDKGDTGAKGDKGEKGDKGDTGEVSLAYANSTFANAIKNKISGNPITISDASTVEHSLSVKAVGATAVSRHGKNIIPFPYVIFTNSNADELEAVALEDGGVLLNGAVTETTYVNICNYRFSNSNISPFSSANGFTANRYNSDVWVGYDDTNGKTFISIKAGAICENIIFYPQIEVGKAVTQYENGVGLQVSEVAEDGTVSGLTSASPYMTLIADNGAIIECEYTADTKAYIDNKIAELLK